MRRKFFTQDILCLITGMNLCPSSPDVVDAIMEFMIGGMVAPHQREGKRAQCKSSLIEQFSWLGEVCIDPASWRDDVEKVVSSRGKFVSVRQSEPRKDKP